ncbi:MAG: hypothetical protein RLZZ618_1012 [Pseudomonadota bacterium]|jgi:lysophospholipase L1-like esterase
MIFSDVFSRSGRRQLACGLSLVAVAALSACGGGEQRETFQARRVVVFGDEASTINADGSKYNINAQPADCAVNPLWIQGVAGGYGISLCTAATDPTKQLNAAAGDKVAEVATKIDTYLASGSPVSTDLVSVFVGVNDVLAAYKASPTPTEEAAMFTAVRAAGTRLGLQIVKVTSRGAKVLVVSVPDQAITPYGRSQALLVGGAANADLLRRLSIAFNDNMRLALGSDPNGGGRSGALIEGFDLITLFTVNLNNQFGTLVNVSQPACGTIAEADLATQCTVAAANTVTNSTWGAWLWTSGTQLSPYGHSLLASQALTRLRGNPL